MARGLKNALGVEDDDGVVAMTSAPIHRFEQGYYFEVEIESVNNSAVGCLGLGVTFMRPKDIPKMPRRLEKLKQGWYFSGPYNGKTRRLYANGAKSMRFILEGEETRPFRWGIGDKMGVLVRPKDFRAEKWQWTVTLYINRNCVMPVAIDVPSKATRHICTLERDDSTLGWRWGFRWQWKLLADVQTSHARLPVVGWEERDGRRAE